MANPKSPLLANLNSPISQSNKPMVGDASTLPIGSHSSTNLTIGNRLYLDRCFDGLIDEFRISNTARSAAWLKASYYNCWDNLLSLQGGGTGTDYTTQFYYDSADRLVSVIYPTGENVTQNYNSRGLPYSLSGSITGNLTTSTLYNSLGSPTQINLGNGLKTTFGYWGTGGGYDTIGGYYGRLWEIMTLKPGESPVQDVKHTWDAGGNLYQRENVLASETETFTYDFLDRLTATSGPYSESYAYEGQNGKIGNLTSKNGASYTYGAKPHAVTQMGAASYHYDANGNMDIRDTQTLTWDVENRPVSISENGTTIATFIYDGDGNRVKKTENGQTILYINKYYEKNLTAGDVTSYYYLGDKLVAMKQGNDLRYIHQDHLTGTSLTTDGNGATVGTIKYLPFGTTLSTTGTLGTDKKFTGQRLDATNLYYYGARYYSHHLGRFISADAVIPDFKNPQNLNRYTYALNNPLKFNDPSGHYVYINGFDVGSLYSSMQNFLYGMPIPSMIEAIVSPVFQAYNTIRATDNYLTQQIEQSNSFTLNIVTSNTMGAVIVDYGIGEKFFGGRGAQTTPKPEIPGSLLEVNSALVENRPHGDVVGALAHDFIHGYGDFLNIGITNSKYEENLCDMYANYICRENRLKQQSPRPNVDYKNESALTTKYENDPYYSILPPFPGDLSYEEQLAQHIVDLY